MLRTLLETRRPASRDRRGALLSLVVHAGVIAATVAATATADAHLAPVHATSVIFTAPNRTEPPRGPAAPTHGGVQAIASPTPSVPNVVVEIPVTLPEILGAVSDPSPPKSSWLPTSSTTGTPLGGNPSGGVWSEQTVEKPVLALGDAPRPRYPELLRSAGVEGDVLAQFVVDTTGLVEVGSIRVLRSAHPLFAQAVERVLPLARFIPAEAGGRRVRQLVQQPFTFAIARWPQAP